jgi:hypothetical protein
MEESTAERRLVPSMSRITHAVKFIEGIITINKLEFALPNNQFPKFLAYDIFHVMNVNYKSNHILGSTCCDPFLHSANVVAHDK